MVTMYKQTCKKIDTGPLLLASPGAICLFKL